MSLSRDRRIKMEQNKQTNKSIAAALIRIKIDSEKVIDYRDKSIFDKK